ncbi:MAG: type II secretion system F family protein [Nanoarchaeota archaeon]
MTLQNLSDNIKKQRELTKELKYFNEYLERRLSDIPERKDAELDLFSRTMNSLMTQLKIVNSSIPELLKNLSISQKLPESRSYQTKDEVKNLVKVEYNNSRKKLESVTLKKDDKQKYFKELRISSELISKLRGRIEKKPTVGGISLQSPSLYGKISNFFYRKTSKRLLDKGHFRNLNISLRKSNSPFIINTYLSIMLFTLTILLPVGIVISSILAKIGWLGSGLTEVMVFKQIGVIIGVELAAWIIIYFSPAMDVSAAAKKIEQELPFVTVHMAAIAGSGIEPSKIFSIIVASDDYPNARKEIIKVINQINYYGYDLVNALKNVAKGTSSVKLAELFKGLATTISGGGSLEAFLHKRAETLLLDYRLDREKYTHIAENFMNIYIALVIAAPMIFLLLLILIGISGTGLNYTPFQLSIMIISGVIIINIIFLVAINAKQPTY